MVAAQKWCYSGLSLSFFALSVSFSSLLHSIFSPLLLWITRSLCLGAKILPIFFHRFDGGGAECVMEFSITLVGAPFPVLLPPPCEWEMISIPPPSISSSSPSALAAFPLPGTSLTTYWITLQLTLHPFPLRLTQTHILFTFASSLSAFCLLSPLSLHASMNLTNSDINESASVLGRRHVLFSKLSPVARSALSTTTRTTSVSACRTPPTN